MDIDEPLKRLLNPENYADQIDANVNPSTPITAEQGNEMFQDLGDQYAGRFIAPSPDSESFEPTDSGFTGAFVSGQGEVFEETRAFIGSVVDGQLQAGFVEDGGLVALGGNYIIDGDGESTFGLTLAKYFEATNAGETRRGFLGMNLPQGATVPAFSIIYTGAEAASLVTNGDFETGDLTGWTDTDSAWEASTVSPYNGTYSAFHDGTAGIFGGDLVQSGITVTAGDVVTVSFANRRAFGILAGRMKIEFIDSSSGVVSTEYIYGAASDSWQTFSGNFVAPASSATVRLTWEVGDPFNDEAIDDVMLYVTDTLQELRFEDSGLKAFSNGEEYDLLNNDKLDVTTADLEVVNTSTETDIWSMTVPGGTLGTDGMIEIDFVGSYLNNTALARSMTIRFYYGGTFITAVNALSQNASATRRLFNGKFYIKATGATNSQRLMSSMVRSDADGTFFDGTSVGHSEGTALIDSTADQTLKITVRHSDAGANISFIRRLVKAEFHRAL